MHIWRCQGTKPGCAEHLLWLCLCCLLTEQDHMRLSGTLPAHTLPPGAVHVSRPCRFQRPSPTWSEDAVSENWITISWDEFTPAARNSMRFWNGGGITVAHELGHYLGLMHTHEGAVPCEGDGLTKADAVPDTPVNLQTAQWAATNGLAVKLSRWCTQFRQGKKPMPKELLAFKSCKQDYLAIDNVFNLLSYLPDQCCMMLTANQIARLQWAVARFRPKMMARYAITT